MRMASCELATNKKKKEIWKKGQVRIQPSISYFSNLHISMAGKNFKNSVLITFNSLFYIKIKTIN